MWGGALGTRPSGATALALCGSVWGEGSERGQCCCLASGGLPELALFPGLHSPHPTPAVRLAPFKLVLNTSGWVCVILRPCRPFKWNLKIQQFLLPPQPPLVFTARSYEDLSSWQWSPGLCGLVWGCNPWPLLIFIQCM